jgi:hypothetical protein
MEGPLRAAKLKHSEYGVVFHSGRVGKASRRQGVFCPVPLRILVPPRRRPHVDKATIWSNEATVDCRY